jgi:putative DNA primase/helicase
VTARDVAIGLGNAYPSGTWWRGRCPVHGGSGAALALKDGDRGLVVCCHAGCSKQEVYAELRRLDLLDDENAAVESASEELIAARNAEKEWRRARRVAVALDVWEQSYGAKGTAVERYWFSRALTIQIPPTIRMHGMMWHRESGDQRPAMVALVEHAEHGPVAVHCTFLAIDGSMKATLEPNKKCLGPVGGGAVRLGPMRHDQWLVIGEGIESTASAMQLWGMSSGWAALSAGNMRNLVIPPEAQRIVIAADNDESGVGQEAARDAAWLWREEGRRVRVALPPLPGVDFNDVLVAENF